MKTENTISENVQTVLILTFVPLIVTGIISLLYGIFTGVINTNLL